MADDIKIELVVDSDGTVKAIKKVENQADASGKKAAKHLKKNLDKAGDGIKSSFKSTFAAVAGFAAAAFAGKEIIGAAAQQEAAVNKLNASLRNSGNFTEQASKDLQAFASQLQSVSTVGDEVILDQLAFAQAMGASVDQSQAIVAAAADMSAALGTDLESATRNITKTLGGLKGELGETIPELGKLTKEQLQSGAAIDVIAGKFQGFAQSEVKTFGGAMAQLQNNFGDLLEQIGLSLIQSPKFIGVINLISEGITKLISEFNVDKLAGFVDSAIVKFTDFLAIGAQLARPFIVMKNTASLAFSAIKTGLQAVVVGVAESVALLGNLPFAEKILPIEQINMFKESARETLSGFTEETMLSFETLMENDQAAADSIINTMTLFRDSVAGMSKSVAKSMASTGKSLKKGSKDVFSFGLNTKQTMFDVGKNIHAALVQSASIGIQSFAVSLFNGKFSMSDFGKSVAGIMGDMAIQIGQTTMAAGFAIESLFGLQGAQAVIAGAALIGLGAIIKSFAGGGGKATPTPAMTGASADTTAIPTVGGPVTTTELAEEEAEEDSVPTIEREQKVQVVVQGDVLDSEETGLRLVEILNSEFENSNGRLVTT